MSSPGAPPAGPRRAGRGLLLACHPLPCLAVTAFATGYAATRDTDLRLLVGVAAAILAGQLTVGWTNDALDTPADLAAGRADKPIPAGLVGRGTVIGAAATAAIGCVLLSFRLGLLAGALHLIAVGSAQSYNLGLKRGLASPVPYLVSFGLLPLLITAAIRSSGVPVGWPPLGQVLAAALLGAAAHAGNTVGDAAADAATGVRGLPQRVGPDRSMLAMGVLVAAAAAVLLIGGGTTATGSRGTLSRVLLGTGVVIALLGALRRTGVRGGRSAFRLTLAAVALVIAGFLAGA